MWGIYDYLCIYHIIGDFKKSSNSVAVYRFHGSCIHAYSKVEIGKYCLIAANCQIIDGNGHHPSFNKVENRINITGEVKEVIIEDNVWLGTGGNNITRC